MNCSAIAFASALLFLSVRSLSCVLIRRIWMIASFASLTLSRIRLARLELRLHVVVADRVERVLLDRDRLRERLSVHREPRLMRARQRERTVGRRAPQHHALERRHRRALQIPGEVLHADRHRRRRRSRPRPPPSSSSDGGSASAVRQPWLVPPAQLRSTLRTWARLPRQPCPDAACATAASLGSARPR